MPSLRRHWSLDPEVTFLNHGSFGACPIPVLEAQDRRRRRLEAEPVRFFTEVSDGALDAARVEAARFVGTDPEGFAFVSAHQAVAWPLSARAKADLAVQCGTRPAAFIAPS